MSGAAAVVASVVMARLVGINHVAVEVDSIDDALAFLGRIFELTLRGRGSRMAFVDMGDQFIALSEGRRQAPDDSRHIGLVVDDREGTLRAARDAGAEMLGDNDFRDPWGNHWQVVDYRDVQFTKTPRILGGMGMPALEKSESAIAELRAKGLAD
jgi:predicted enzyme related to lactoylglutathione lyase